MQSLFRQTRTHVDTPSAQQRQRQRGAAASARAAAAIQLGVQFLLWVTFFGYDQTAQTIWQAALMLLFPLLTLWFVWRGTAVDHPSARWWTLPLTLCLFLDALLIITAFGGFVRQLIPNAPAWFCTVIPVAACWMTAVCARWRGVRYGSWVMLVPLVILLVFGTIFLRASTRADRLWPIWGDGLLSTAAGALPGAGSTWSAALLFALQRDRSAGWKTSLWAIAPWGLCVLWALWFGFLRPWAAGDSIPIAEKMMGLARHANSVILYEAAGVMWMLLLPTALTACLSSSEMLALRAFPRLPRLIPLTLLAAAPAAVVLLWPERLFGLMAMLLPWRFVLSLICGAGLMIWQRRRS